MTNGQPTGSDSPMEDTGGVSGMMNLTINLPDNVRISTVDTDQEETTVSNGNTTGMIQIYAGSTAPAGWLLCNGAAVSRETYADLFAVIGTVYGVGNANTTFNLPDMRGRYPLGKDDMGGVSADRATAAEADVLGSSGGAEKHTLTVAEMPEHTHAMLVHSASSAGVNPGEDQRHSEFAYLAQEASGSNRYGKYGVRQRWSREYDEPQYPYIAYPAGSGQTHNNMPPYQTLNYIIKT